MTISPDVFLYVFWGVILFLVGWIVGYDHATFKHRRQCAQEQHESLLRSISQDLAALREDQQRLAAYFNLPPLAVSKGLPKARLSAL
jgi:hypothetical protein